MAAGPGEDQMAVFEALELEMGALFDEGTPDALEKCEEIAKLLLSYAELPLGMRCRVCIELAAFDKPGYLEWAQEAMRVLELAWAQNDEHSEAEVELRQWAERCLAQAKEDFEKAGGYDYEGKEEEEEPTTTSLDHEEEKVTGAFSPATPAQQQAAEKEKSNNEDAHIQSDESA